MDFQFRISLQNFLLLFPTIYGLELSVILPAHKGNAIIQHHFEKTKKALIRVCCKTAFTLLIRTFLPGFNHLRKDMVTCSELMPSYSLHSFQIHFFLFYNACHVCHGLESILVHVRRNAFCDFFCRLWIEEIRCSD